MSIIKSGGWWLSGIGFLVLGAAVNAIEPGGGGVAPEGWVSGTSSRIMISDCVKVVREDPAGVARIDRVLENPRGYRWDAPGARIRFRTDGAEVAVHLLYSARHIGPARNSLGFYLIDGRAEPAWHFTRPEGSAFPGDAALVLKLPVPAAKTAAATFHDYELILPYGDAVELQGVAVSPSARWEQPAARPATRWVAFGDSLTHGFTASAVIHTYPFLVGQAKNWQVINAGFGGRGCQTADGDYLAGIEADRYSVAIGTNDWQGGTELEAFRHNLTSLLQRLRKGRPSAPVYVFTSLWVPPRWKPPAVKYPLESYRSVVRDVIAELADERMQLVDGPALIDHDEAFFDAVAVHPNDKGFAQMAERLARVFQ